MERVNHFQAYGRKLVRGFAELCQEELQFNEAQLQAAAKDPVKVYADSLRAVSENSKTLLKKKVRDVEADWRKEQQELHAGIEAAIAICEE